MPTKYVKYAFLIIPSPRYFLMHTFINTSRSADHSRFMTISVIGLSYCTRFDFISAPSITTFLMAKVIRRKVILLLTVK